MSKCRECGKEIDRYTTMFGYCKKCCVELGGEPTEELEDN